MLVDVIDRIHIDKLMYRRKEHGTVRDVILRTTGTLHPTVSTIASRIIGLVPIIVTTADLTIDLGVLNGLNQTSIFNVFHS
jgi:hypothetical protein